MCTIKYTYQYVTHVVSIQILLIDGIKEKEKGKVNQLDVGNKKTNTTVVVTIQGQLKSARTKPDDQQLEQVIIIAAH